MAAGAAPTAAGVAPAPSRVSGEELLLEGPAGHRARQQLAADVAARGFGIIRLSARSGVPLASAASAAERFFSLPPTQKESTRRLFDEAHVGAKGLVGFNMVSPAKAVFRIRRYHDAGDLPAAPSAKRRRTAGEALGAAKQELAEEPDDSVWPPESVLNGFRRDMEAAWLLLERLLSNCAAALLGEAEHQRWEEQHSTVAPAQRWSASPLDLFHYPNDEIADATVNCTEHKDPGLLSLIPCAKVAGLMVRAHGDDFKDESPAPEIETEAQIASRRERWVGVESLPGATPHCDVVVSKNEEFCVKSEKLCIKNEELCIKNEDFVSKMMKFAGIPGGGDGGVDERTVEGDRPRVGKNDDFCIKNEELCIKNEEFCIQNEEFCSVAKADMPRFSIVYERRAELPCRQHIANATVTSEA